jgi:2-(3-amino-3-carboxypropyl)histidine synthase
MITDSIEERIITDVLKDTKEYSRIAIQAPEGLKKLSEVIARELERSGKEVLIFADPCYGACDPKDEEARGLGADVLVHLGHADFGLEKCIPVLFYPYYYEVDVSEEDAARISDALGDRDFSICFSVNFDRIAHRLASALSSIGKRPRELQRVLGCSFPSVDGVALYVGDGLFHPLGVAVNNSVIAFDPFTRELNEISGEDMDRRKRGRLLGVLNAERVGILVSTKKGQQHFRDALVIKRHLENRGKKAEILVMDRIERDSLTGYGVDAYVNTACPRIATDDDLGKPTINYAELVELESEEEKS